MATAVPASVLVLPLAVEAIPSAATPTMMAVVTAIVPVIVPPTKPTPAAIEMTVEMIVEAAEVTAALTTAPAESRSSLMAAAITAMQFQDVASQLVAHTTRRLRHCADRLAAQAMGEDDEDGRAVVETLPLCPNPVTQDEMDAGSVELF